MTQQDNPLDDTDRRIIAILQADGRRPYSQIAEDLGIPASSVRYRVQRLEDNGVLQIVGIANPLTIGFDRFAMIGLKVRPGTAREVCRRLSELPETSYVIMTAGQYDVMAEVICHDTGHFTNLVNERMHQIERGHFHRVLLRPGSPQTRLRLGRQPGRVAGPRRACSTRARNRRQALVLLPTGLDTHCAQSTDPEVASSIGPVADTDNT